MRGMDSRIRKYGWGGVAFCFLLAGATVNAQPTSWEMSMAAGQEAYDQARYDEAEESFLAALKEAETFEPEDSRLATSLNNLAMLYYSQGNYGEAEPLYQRALAIWEKARGPEHPNLALGLNTLAALYFTQGKYGEAEPLLQRALAIAEKALGPEHPNVATSLNNLAAIYFTQGKYGEAEPLYKRALAIWEKGLGPDHPDVATSLNNLAALYRNQGKYGEAEPLYQRAIAIQEKALGPDHPKVATSLNNLAALYDAQSKYGEAEPLLLRALAIPGESPGTRAPQRSHQPQQPGGALLLTGQVRRGRALLPARHRDRGEKPWDRSTRTYPWASTPWRCSTTHRASMPRPSPFTSARWQ